MSLQLKQAASLDLEKKKKKKRRFCLTDLICCVAYMSCRSTQDGMFSVNVLRVPFYCAQEPGPHMSTYCSAF